MNSADEAVPPASIRRSILAFQATDIANIGSLVDLIMATVNKLLSLYLNYSGGPERGSPIENKMFFTSLIFK